MGSQARGGKRGDSSHAHEGDADGVHEDHDESVALEEGVLVAVAVDGVVHLEEGAVVIVEDAAREAALRRGGQRGGRGEEENCCVGARALTWRRS